MPPGCCEFRDQEIWEMLQSRRLWSRS